MSTTRSISVTWVLAPPEDSGVAIHFRRSGEMQKRRTGETFYDHQPSASTLGVTEATLFAGDEERNDEAYRA